MNRGVNPQALAKVSLHTKPNACSVPSLVRANSQQQNLLLSKTGNSRKLDYMVKKTIKIEYYKATASFKQNFPKLLRKKTKIGR